MRVFCLRGCFVALALLAGLFPPDANAGESGPAEERSVENLAAFARVYGYVRFFHPGERAQGVDWDKVAQFGAEKVRDAADAGVLRAAILAVLQPIAPALELSTRAHPRGPAGDEPKGRVIFWQHEGIPLSEKEGLYRQRRVTTGPVRSESAPLFKPAVAPAPLGAEIASGLFLHLPLALPVGDDGHTAEDQSGAYAVLQGQLAASGLAALTAADWRLRVAGVMSVWNVFQHFHPYLDERGVKWLEALRPALRRALRDQNAEGYHATLSELVARTEDGHGYVYGRPPGNGGMPIRVAVVAGKLTVTAAAAEAAFRRGDILERIDGVPALEILRERERYAAGSAHLRRFRALNQFGEGPVGSTARVELVRDGRLETVMHVRATDTRGYFFNSIGEFEFPALTELRPGIHYVNLQSADAAELQAMIPRLAEARGVIFDGRWDGRRRGEATAKRISPHTDVIAHLITQPIQASPMMIPQVTRPDRVGWTYKESTWPVQPKAPRFRGRVAWINDPSVVSYGETCMAMIAHHRLAVLVGEPTAGCNGNVNFIPLPGGFRVMWTGMDVRRMDRSSFYGVGFGPDVPVTRTLESVQAGRDVFLEAAIAALEKAAGPEP